MDRVPRPLIEGMREDLLPLVEGRRDGALKAILVNLHPADIAAVITVLGSDDDQQYVFPDGRSRDRLRGAGRTPVPGA